MPEEEEREKLAKVIRQWNNNRLDLFEISQPDEKLQFHGVMRFYLEDPDGDNVATKCLRVCGSSAARVVVETLSEKFRPNMKMLTTSYSLYEIHGSKERKLDLDERPLVVQLNWNSDNREGRFVLKKDKDGLEEKCPEKEKGGMIKNFKRTLSRKGKKKDKNKTTVADRDEDELTENTLNNSVCLSEAQKLCAENKKQQKHAAMDHPGLPVGIKFCDTSEEAVLSAVINYANSSTVHFKLSPAYILYAVSHFTLQRHHSRGSGRTHSVTAVTNKMVAMTGKVIQRQQTIAGALAFWMANSSELLNFLKHDKDLSPLTCQSQLDLSHLVHEAYSHLLQCLQNELRKHLPAFLIDPEQHGPLPAGIEMVLNTLMNAMSLLRRCRVNAALTIQVFSQLFHFISAWLFNRLMRPEAGTPGLRSHYWGAALRQRLTAIEAWAERQGLELAVDCHLGHIVQATTLLTMNKYSMQDAEDIQRNCFKLNSLQLQTLLSGYLYATSEPHIPPGLMDAAVTAAEASADRLLRSEGRDVQAEESLDLHLPFLLPEGGYSCDTVTGIPPGFVEFLEPICQKGLCSLTSRLNSKGDWTVHFSEAAPSEENTYAAADRQPEMVTITLNKPLNSGMGVSIVAAKGAGQENLGIYIKSIVRGGPAKMNGRLTAGDQLLSVNGRSLVGISQERAAAIMMQTGPVVTLQVAKLGASFHGLQALLRDLTPDRTTGDRDHIRPNRKALLLYGVVDPGPSERLHGGSRRKREQMMQRNRQLYRSNPNMSDVCLEDRDEPADPAVRGNNMASVSSISLCTDPFHREYLTLPTPKSQNRDVSERSGTQQTLKVSLRDAQSCSKRSFMHRAPSQEDLCADSGRPLLDKQQNMRPRGAKQTTGHNSSFPIRSCVSTHDLLCDLGSPAKHQQGARTSGAGIWRTPFSQQSAPAPSIQPIRIDIPVTRASSSHSNPHLTTFQHSSSSLTLKMSQTLKVGGHRQSPHSPAGPVHSYQVSVNKKLPAPSLSSQHQRSDARGDRAAKPQVSIAPTKHVSFQEAPQKKSIRDPGEAPDPWRREAREPPGPWRREAQEQLEKQQRLQAVELLQQELRELQAKAERTAEENERLRRLSLEWQFQKRLQEIQQRGEDDEEEEEEDKDLDMMMMIQQLDRRTQKKRSCVGDDDRKTQAATLLSKQEEEAETDGRPSHHVHNEEAHVNQEEKIIRASAPEKLTFRERQRLFSLTSSA
ncbi:afadin-like [Brachyistius frenatus]|uniref:afadin-like n=1 Tax=Brachyistius frenatus TaxID=100188 RepID=UPI0037E78BE6